MIQNVQPMARWAVGAAPSEAYPGTCSRAGGLDILGSLLCNQLELTAQLLQRFIQDRAVVPLRV